MRIPNARILLSSQVIANSVLTLLLTLLLCTCDRAPQAPPTSIVGNVRYDESTQILKVDVAVDPLENGFPSLFGSAIPAFLAAGPGHFRDRRTLPFTSPLTFSVPCATSNCPLELIFSPPFADSIPAVINKKQSVHFAAGSTGLLETEYLEAFFESEDRSAPRRILLKGPTSSGIFRLPKEALSNIPAGKYQVYLIKQQLHKDSLSTLQSSIQMEYFTSMVPVEVKE